MAFIADGHSGVHHGTGRLGKWHGVFGMDKRAAECITFEIYIAALSELSNSSTERSVEQSCEKSRQSALGTTEEDELVMHFSWML